MHTPETVCAISVATYKSLYAIVKEQLGERPTGLTSQTGPTGPQDGGGERDRTDDPLRARQVLSQLSYTPKSD